MTMVRTIAAGVLIAASFAALPAAQAQQGVTRTDLQ